MKTQSIDIEKNQSLLSINEDAKRKSVAHFIMTYFKFAYYIGLSPFRFKYMHGRAFIVTWWLPKVFWAMVLFPCILFRIGESRDILEDFGSDSDWNPAAYFRVFHAIAKTFFNAAFWYHLGFESSRYLNVVNFINESMDLPVPQLKHIVWKTLCPSLNIAFIVLGILLGTTYVGRFLDCNVNSQMEDLQSMFQFCVNWGKYLFFIRNERVQCETVFSSTDNKYFMTSLDTVIGTATCIMTFVRHMNGFYQELLMPTGVFVFWLCSREFANRLRNVNVVFHVPSNKGFKAWESVLAWYSSLRELSVVIKDAYGMIILQRLILMVFDIPISFKYKSSDQKHQLRFVLLFLTSASLYIFAADASRQVKSLETWISKAVENDLPGVTQQHLSVLLHELQANTVGISTKIGFTINYAFVANVSGILITYFIICVQNNPSTP